MNREKPEAAMRHFPARRSEIPPYDYAQQVGRASTHDRNFVTAVSKHGANIQETIDTGLLKFAAIEGTV